MALRSARDSQIFIIGCGISGIGAAQKLLKHGFHNVHIIEATARSGGRIRTGRLGNVTVMLAAVVMISNLRKLFFFNYCWGHWAFGNLSSSNDSDDSLIYRLLGLVHQSVFSQLKSPRAVCLGSWKRCTFRKRGYRDLYSTAKDLLCKTNYDYDKKEPFWRKGSL